MSWVILSAMWHRPAIGIARRNKYMSRPSAHPLPLQSGEAQGCCGAPRQAGLPLAACGARVARHPPPTAMGAQ
eukprot:5017167-Alexandrium_andersonii.AAC.1